MKEFAILPKSLQDRVQQQGKTVQEIQPQPSPPEQQQQTTGTQLSLYTPQLQSQSRMLQRDEYIPEKPDWHAPWKLMRVIAGHQGWVRSIAVEPENKWFATGSNDNTIKVWDLASGQLKLTLTGHVMSVRDIAISERHPYMFSCSEDKTVKCWDLEKNKVVRDYYGHLSGVYSMDLHPTLDVLVTGSRDSTVRVWDMRTTQGIFVLSGHKQPITNVKCQSVDPQIISTSNDKTVRLWDLCAGKTQTVLTHHKKSIRALTLHPEEWTFATGSPDAIKQWKFPEGTFMHDFVPHHNAIVNTLSVNQDNVLFSGGDDGTMGFYDWKTGHKFQEMSTTALPGSLESENGILTSTFDKTGMRLITGEADKGIKIWREDPHATEESHPGIKFDPENYKRRY
jgi:pleiotropic regulator 1